MDIFIKFNTVKVRLVHYWGVKGYNFPLILHDLLWKTVLSQQTVQTLMKCGISSWFSLFAKIAIFSIKFDTVKVRLVHCIYWGITGYNFPKILYDLLWRMVLSQQTVQPLMKCRTLWSWSSLFAKVAIFSIKLDTVKVSLVHFIY